MSELFNYKSKAQKYKQKYLTLRNQLGQSGGGTNNYLEQYGGGPNLDALNTMFSSDTAFMDVFNPLQEVEYDSNISTEFRNDNYVAIFGCIELFRKMNHTLTVFNKSLPKPINLAQDLSSLVTSLRDKLKDQFKVKNKSRTGKDLKTIHNPNPYYIVCPPAELNIAIFTLRNDTTNPIDILGNDGTDKILEAHLKDIKILAKRFRLYPRVIDALEEVCGKVLTLIAINKKLQKEPVSLSETEKDLLNFKPIPESSLQYLDNVRNTTNSALVVLSNKDQPDLPKMQDLADKCSDQIKDSLQKAVLKLILPKLVSTHL